MFKNTLRETGIVFKRVSAKHSSNKGKNKVTQKKLMAW